MALAGCPSDVKLRPGDHGNYAVAFTCPSSPVPLIVLRGLGATPFPKPADFQYDRQSVDMNKIVHAAGLLGSVTYFGPNSAKAPPCATHPSGLGLSISDYGKIDDMVEGLLRWMLHDDLDVELVIFIRPRFSN